MKKQINYAKVAPDAMAAMREVEKYLRKTGLDRKLMELIKIRASQLNRCSSCLNIHTLMAKEYGESEERINQISNWRESDLFTPEEKAVFRLSEHVTLIADKRLPEEVYQEVREYYDDESYINLVMAINQINSWNRLSITMGVSE